MNIEQEIVIGRSWSCETCSSDTRLLLVECRSCFRGWQLLRQACKPELRVPDWFSCELDLRQSCNVPGFTPLSHTNPSWVEEKLTNSLFFDLGFVHSFLSVDALQSWRPVLPILANVVFLETESLQLTRICDCKILLVWNLLKCGESFLCSGCSKRCCIALQRMKCWTEFSVVSSS